MYGIIDENKKFILLDDDYNRLRMTASLLVKETDSGFVPMFDEDSIDNLIQEYQDEEIEKGYDGNSYLKGYAPLPTKEEQQEKRHQAYIAEVDELHSQRLRHQALGDWTEEDEQEYITNVVRLSNEIAERYPYPDEQ